MATLLALNMQRISLDGPWQLTWRNQGQGLRQGLERGNDGRGQWIAAKVPGDVHLDLLRAGLIEDPSFGRNAQRQKWMEKREWWLRREFRVEADDQGRWELEFGGLDLIADVYLNGELIGHHENAFVAASFPLEKALRSGRNLLVVRLTTGLAEAEQRPWRPYTDKEPKPRVWLRKPQYTFGWDWAPRLLSCGIWRPVVLTRIEHASFRDVQLISHLRARPSPNESARLEVKVEIENVTGRALDLTLNARLKGARRQATETTLRAPPGRRVFRVLLPLSKVQRWWPRGHGEPYLYELELELRRGRELLDRRVLEHGFRSVRLVQRPIAEEGESFFFEINGKKVFLKGANWVPMEVVPGAAQAEKCERLLDLAAQAEFNCLRVWGGGVYEDPAFYAGCDRRGIAVWQDFMYACGLYPDQDPRFLRNVTLETEAVIRRLRNHPSLIVWCGNNENQTMYRAQTIASPGAFHGGDIYHRVIPGALRKLDPTRPYWPGSPVSSAKRPHHLQKVPRNTLSAALEDLPDAEEAGDRHSWHVSLGEPPHNVDFRQYAKDRAKFVSEFGYLSEPNLETFREYAPRDEQRVNSPTYRFHDNPFNRGNIDRALEKYGSGPKLPLEQRFLESQLIQGEALRFGITHFRRRMFACGGTLFWMFSDCWGCPGWTIVDASLRKKASFWAIKRVFAPRLLSFEDKANGLSIWLTNEQQAFQGTLEFGLASFDGTQILSQKKRVRVPANASLPVAELTMPLRDNWYGGWRDHAFAFARIAGAGRMLRAQAFFREPLQLPLPRATLSARLRRSRGVLEVSSDVYAMAVHLELPSNFTCDDNFFDLWPGERRRIQIQGEGRLPRALRVRLLNGRSLSV